MAFVHWSAYLVVEPRATKCRFSASRAVSTSTRAELSARSGVAPSRSLCLSAELMVRPVTVSQSAPARTAAVAPSSPMLNTRLVRRNSVSCTQASAARVTAARPYAAHGTDLAAA